MPLRTTAATRAIRIDRIGVIGGIIIQLIHKNVNQETGEPAPVILPDSVARLQEARWPERPICCRARSTCSFSGPWPRADARLGDLAAHPAGLRRRAAGDQGSLYPALHRLEEEGWIAAEWGASEEQPPGEVLRADEGRPETARRRGRELAADRRRRRPGAVAGLMMLRRIRRRAAVGAPAHPRRARARPGAAVPHRHAHGAAVRAGLPPAAARRAAPTGFGTVAGVKDDVRDVWLGRRIDAALEDVRYGLRTLRRRPGIRLRHRPDHRASASAPTPRSSAVVNGVLLRPLPYRAPESLVVLRHGSRRRRAAASVLGRRSSRTTARPGLDGVVELPHDVVHPAVAAGQHDDAPERVTTASSRRTSSTCSACAPMLGRAARRGRRSPGRRRCCC